MVPFHYVEPVLYHDRRGVNTRLILRRRLKKRSPGYSSMRKFDVLCRTVLCRTVLCRTVLCLGTSNDLYRLYGFYYLGLPNAWDLGIHRENRKCETTDAYKEDPSVADCWIPVVHGSDGNDIYPVSVNPERRRIDYVRICPIAGIHSRIQDRSRLRSAHA